MTAIRPRRPGRILGLLAALLVPRLALALCAPSASGIFPASGVIGTSVTATVAGSALDGATVAVFGEPGLVATVLGSSDVAANLRLDIDAAAPPGERILVLETPGGATGVSFTVNPPGGPIVDDASPPLVASLGVPLAVTLSGANLGGIGPAAFAVSGAGVTVASATPSPDGTTLAVDFTVDTAADLGTHAVTITTPAGSVVLQLYVQRPPPLLTNVEPAAGEQGATVPLVLSGSNLTGAALIITGSDVAVAGVATPDDATLTATLTIAPTATLSTSEPRLLIVTTESGQTTTEFFVVAPNVPTVTAIRPAAGEPGDTVAVTLRGLNLTGGGVTEGSADLTLQNVVVVDDRTVTLEVVVAPGATTAVAGVPHTLTVTTGDGMGTATFFVVPAAQPFIAAVRPPFGNRGTTFTLFLEGVNLADVQPGDGIDLSGDPKVIATNAAAVSDELARATLEIEPTAAAGFRDVELTTNPPPKTATKVSGFRVNVPGQVPTIDDVAPDDVAPGTTVPITVTGSNFEGGSALVTGPGATVANVVVDAGGTVMTFDLTLAADAPDENRAVIVVTENGTARCGIGTLATPPALVAAKLVKTGAVFQVADTSFRLFVFEFSPSPLFPTGLRTAGIPDADGLLVLSRSDTVRIERAFREHYRGYVRARAFTAVNRIGVSAPQTVRR